MFFIWLLVKLITPFTKIHVGDFGDCFYDDDDNTIYIDLDIDEGRFRENLATAHKYETNLGLLIWTILHEIGHHFTYKYIDENEDEVLRLVYKNLFKKKLITEKTWQDLYYELDSEWEATEWAINFIEKHKRLCKFFNKMFEVCVC